MYVDNPGKVQEGGPVTQEEYNKIVTLQLTELWSNYGDLFEIWFDGGVLSKDQGGADVLSLVQKYNLMQSHFKVLMDILIWFVGRK